MLSEALEHPFLDAFWQAGNPDLSRIEVPAFLVASAGNQGLHVRGTLEAFKRIRSTEKWLDIHGRKEWRYYYLPENMERQRAFFDHFLKARGCSTVKAHGCPPAPGLSREVEERRVAIDNPCIPA